MTDVALRDDIAKRVQDACERVGVDHGNGVGVAMRPFEARHGINNGSIKRLITGERMPTPENLVKIAAALQETPEWLLFGVRTGAAIVPPLVEKMDLPPAVLFALRAEKPPAAADYDWWIARAKVHAKAFAAFGAIAREAKGIDSDTPPAPTMPSANASGGKTVERKGRIRPGAPAVVRSVDSTKEKTKLRGEQCAAVDQRPRESQGRDVTSGPRAKGLEIARHAARVVTTHASIVLVHEHRRAALDLTTSKLDGRHGDNEAPRHVDDAARLAVHDRRGQKEDARHGRPHPLHRGRLGAVLREAPLGEP